MAACLAVVLGGGIANAATVDSAAARGTTTIAGNADRAADRLDQVDWASVVEPELNCPEPGPHAAWYVVRARVAAVGDLTHDGRRETVVVSSCPSSTSSNPLIAFVYDEASSVPSTPHLLGKLGKNRYFKSLKVAIRGGRVHLYGKALSDRAPRCCPDLIVSQTYRWDGAKFRSTAETANRIS
jgi:flavin-binding protein dodecin